MRTQTSVERKVVKRVKRSRPSAATRAPSPQPAPAVVIQAPRTLLPEPAPAVVARRPRTSLIDAEWEWLALRAELRARSVDDDEDDELAREAFVQPHTKTLPPPPFQPYAAPRPVPVAENSQTLKSVAPEPSRRARRASTRRTLGVLVMTALVCFAAGVGLLHGAASFIEREHGRATVELAARMKRPRPAAPGTAALSRRAAAPAEAPGQLAVADARNGALLPPSQLVERPEPARASKAPPTKAKRGRPHPSASPAVVAKKRWARPSRASDNPY